MSEKLFNVGIKAIIMRGDKVLIAKDPDGYWEVPGGRIDADESVEEALRRELSEELPNISKVEIHEILSAGRLQKDIHDDVSLVLVFYRVTADFEGGEPTLSHEHLSYKWATKDEALKVVYDLCKPAIEKAYNISQP